MKTLIVTLFAALILAGCSTMPHPTSREVAVGAAYASVLADVTSTSYVLSQGCAEGNPVLGIDPSNKMLALDALVRIGVIYGLDQYLQYVHSDAQWPFWLLAGAQGAVAAHNLGLNCRGTPR